MKDYMVKNIIIINTGLNPNSHTAILANETYKILKKKKNVKTSFIDLRKIKMEFCDGRKIDKYNKEMQLLYKKLEKADAYIIGTPVYNYGVSGVCKNFLDVYSKTMKNKYYGIVHNSGGVRSWGFGVEDLMKNLGLHSNVTLVQPPVHSFKDDYNDKDEIVNKIIYEKIDEMLKALVKAC